MCRVRMSRVRSWRYSRCQWGGSLTAPRGLPRRSCKCQFQYENLSRGRGRRGRPSLTIKIRTMPTVHHSGCWALAGPAGDISVGLEEIPPGIYYPPSHLIPVTNAGSRQRPSHPHCRVELKCIHLISGPLAPHIPLSPTAS